MQKIGINLHAIAGLNDQEYIKKIAELGFNATFSGVVDKKRQEQIANLCAKYSIEYQTLHAPFGTINDIWLNDHSGYATLNELMNCIDHCALAGVKIAVVHLSSGLTPPSITDIGRYRFEKLVDYATIKNVKIAFENQRKIANLAWAIETFADGTNCGFCWDCGHEGCFTNGIEFMQLFGEKLICTHIHDNLGQFNQDLHLLPFDGKLNFNRIAKHLRRYDTCDTLMLEVIEKNSDFYNGLSPDEYLLRAKASADKLMNLINK